MVQVKHPIVLEKEGCELPVVRDYNNQTERQRLLNYLILMYTKTNDDVYPEMIERLGKEIMDSNTK